MTIKPDSNAVQHQAAAQATDSTPSDRPAYIYASAGISERQGQVPVWLWAVVFLLLAWGIYYLVEYWNAPLA
jgi:hypothetical protein